jgi:NAD(P)-dependent dehydrogenase (short-subunit alcohol dehydrogenase family)
MTLANRVVIISGSGRGIGREMARLFSSEGARIVVADIDAESAGAVAAEINAAGHVARATTVDVGDPAQFERLIRETVVHFGRLDVLVNNAGVGLNKPFLATTPAEWEQQLRVNLTGTFLCAQAAAQVMVRQRAGTIVNVASISGQRGGQGRAAYGASKAGVILLTKVMAVELAPLGIRVNAIAPGPVDTDQSRGTHTQATRQAYFDRIPIRSSSESWETWPAVT